MGSKVSSPTVGRSEPFVRILGWAHVGAAVAIAVGLLLADASRFAVVATAPVLAFFALLGFRLAQRRVVVDSTAIEITNLVRRHRVPRTEAHALVVELVRCRLGKWPHSSPWNGPQWFVTVSIVSTRGQVPVQALTRPANRPAAGTLNVPADVERLAAAAELAVEHGLDAAD